MFMAFKGQFSENDEDLQVYHKKDKNLEFS